MKSIPRVKMAQPKFLQAIKLEEHASGTLLKNGCLSYHLKKLQSTQPRETGQKRTISGFQALQLEFFYIHFLPLKSVVWGFPGDPVVKKPSVAAGDTGP